MRILLAVVMMLACGFARAQGADESTVVVPDLSVDPVGYEESITLQWQAPGDRAVSGFHIYRESGGVVELIDTVGPGDLDYVVTGHSSGDVYSVQAFAFGPRSEGALPWCDYPQDVG